MIARCLILSLCFAAGFGLVMRAERPEPTPPRTTFDRFPMALGTWQGVQEPPLDPRVLAVLGVDDYLSRAYYTSDRSAAVGLYVGYYGSQRQGDTMHSPQNCLPGSGWEPVSNRLLRIAIPSAPAGSSPVAVNRYLIQKGIDQQLVLYWYQSHGRAIASEYWAKYYLIRDAIRLNRTDGALVRVIAPIVPEHGETQAEMLAVRFVQDLFPALAGYLPG
jgi:EpsI family protein